MLWLYLLKRICELYSLYFISYIERNTMSDIWSTSIEKLMSWRSGSWQKYDVKTTMWTLRLYYDVVLITADTKIFETISLSQNKIKGIYKGDILILIINNLGKEVRKIKFQIKFKVEECLQRIAKYFPVINHDKLNQEKVFESRYRNIDEVMKAAVEGIEKTSSLTLLPEFNNFVKLCLMDPKMPQIISDTQKIIEDLKKA